MVMKVRMVVMSGCGGVCFDWEGGRKESSEVLGNVLSLCRGSCVGIYTDMKIN